MNYSSLNPPKNVLGLDWETYYDDEYTLKKLTTTAYIRDPRFQIHGASVRWSNDRSSRWLLRAELIPYLESIDWSTTALLAHHAHFDGLILTHHLKLIPAYYYDTLSMGRALYGMETGASLDALARFCGLGQKIEGYLVDVKGQREPSKAALKKLGQGAKRDNDLMWKLFRLMLPEFPSDELDLIHYTVKCFVEPVLQVDKERARKLHEKVVKERKKLLKRVAETKRFTESDRLDLQTKLRSRTQFPLMLQKLGVDPPLKISPSWIKKPVAERDPTKKYTYAFAANDLQFLALREHPNKQVRDLVEAKLLCSSSIHETRPLRMIEHADPALTIYLNYWGARTTGRWCMKGDVEVLTPQGWVCFDNWRGEPIMQWNQGQLNWSPAKINVFQFNGTMPRLECEYIKGSFTPEHRLPSYTTKGNFKVRTAIKAQGLNLTVPISGSHDGSGLGLSLDELRLLVAFQADGSFDRNRITFKFRKQRKIDRLRWLLTRLGIRFQRWTSDKYPETIIAFPQRLVKHATKSFSWDLLRLSVGEKRQFIEELQYWDGGRTGTLIRYFTTHKENAKLVATLAHCCDMRAYIHIESRKAPQNDKYTVQIKPTTVSHPRASQWTEEKYEGYVYCPTVSAGYFLVRSEGSIFVTGNSGGDSMNPQNLGRDGELRGAILPPKNHKFVVGDSTAIEAVLNAWSAGQADLLEQFADLKLKARGEDPYTLFASDVYGRRITKRNKIERYVGKVGILGCGYQMGAAKLQFTFETGMLGPTLVLPMEMYKSIIDTYRHKMKAIVNQWYTFHDMLKKMMHPGFYESYRNYLLFEHAQVVLPNEMALQYPRLRYQLDEDEEGREQRNIVYKENTKIYGGKLVENVIQAIARVVVGQQYLRIADRYRMVLLAHDEIVLVVPTRQTKRAAKELQETLNTAPDWCKDAPLSGEVGIFDRYVKM